MTIRPIAQPFEEYLADLNSNKLFFFEIERRMLPSLLSEFSLYVIFQFQTRTQINIS